ncbi:recombinase family protein [Actinokineospora guangxiensis]|uniref:Recombinase family protein n=1 Tax=Actinokineospora guangxiensis TaxID=1490288 RepID=A0ABW0EUY5_9PSEU
MDHLPSGKQRTHIVAFDYARLSRDKNGLSENVNIQHGESRDFIADQGWEHGGSREDNDISASRFGTKVREGYQLLLKNILSVPDRDDAQVKVMIVVTEMPRLYRQVEELLPLIKLAEHSKLSGIWTTDGEGYDLSTPEGIHRAIGAVNNAMLESNRASVRQRRKKKAQAAQGKFLGTERRYGYEGAVKNEHGYILNRGRIGVAEVPHEIANLEDWFTRLIAGETAWSIVQDSNRLGIPAPRGGKWTAGNFNRLITRESYVVFDPIGHPSSCPCLQNREDGGTLVHTTSGTRHRGEWRGLITRDRHELLMSVLSARSQGWERGLARGRRYLLSGLTRCGGTHEDEPCLAVMYGNGRSIGQGYQRRYRCKSFDNHGSRVGCGKVFRDADALEAFVTEAVLYRLDSQSLHDTLSRQTSDDTTTALTSRLTALRQRRALIQRQYALGELESLDDYKLMLAELDSAIEASTAELRNQQDARVSALLPEGGNIREVWEARDLAWRRSILGLLIEQIIVLPGHPGGMMWNGYRFNPAFIEIEWKY